MKTDLEHWRVAGVLVSRDFIRNQILPIKNKNSDSYERMTVASKIFSNTHRKEETNGKKTRNTRGYLYYNIFAVRM